MHARQQAAAALFFEGNRRMADGDFSGAESCLREALRIAPDLAEAHGNLGFLLDRRGAAEEAERCHRRSIALNPAYAQTHLNLGVNLAQRKHFDAAEKAYREALRLNPQSAAAWSNLGVLCACMKREREAEQCYRTAMALDADYANAIFNLSYLLLRQGRFEEGWRCLEARDWYAVFADRLACPRWRGESLAGKSLLITFEAGHGDMIQFCRYAATLKGQGAASITVICHPALKTLFATLAGADEVVDFDEPLPPTHWDFWTPPLSLPHYCDTRLDSIPAALPYLRADADRAARWAPQLPPDGVRVGLVWKGSTNFENDVDRSLPSLDMLAPLGQVAGVRFVSLQKGAGEDEARQPPDGLAVVDLGSRVGDFADTAAIVANLDLVISVDTAVAHLAGALGKPCWVLLPDYKTDWRWLTGRSDSPWYPDVMRLFRQAKAGNWVPVIAEVRTALESFVAHVAPQR
ncbi:MAG: tetratricopeptide repeat-containing glycosyltransferase family protein [Rhodocyclaceae bacterium]|nr:tetratricopeptide repeat-containing glycosyltransferase family protein [Rhodocyclaceae bacterium]